VVRSAEPQRLVASLAESLLARGALKPATFVGKLWLSYKARSAAGALAAQLCRLDRCLHARKAHTLFAASWREEPAC
jgi:hypothetical protein